MRLFVLFSFFLALAFPLPSSAAFEHGLALHGKPKYAPDFTHFDYVNPEAPKGGSFKLASIGTFDNLNPYILKGLAADGASLVFATLMESASDEPFSQYGLIAESVDVPEDRSWVSYKLRDKIFFSDGSPIMPEDVLFSFSILKEKGHPFYRSYYKDVIKAEKTGPREVKFSFREKGNTELPLIMGQLPVLSEKFWKGRDFDATTLSPIVGSGPYKVQEVIAGRSITYERVKNWWGESIPVSKGRHNFDTLRYDYYRDATVVLEAFFAGQIDFRLENVAKNWATAYTTPAVKSGLIQKSQIKNALPSGMQGFVFNTRKELFKNPKVREALAYAFDFEWTNKMVAHGVYKRTASYFENSEMAGHGLPSAEEIKLLEPYRGQLPDQVFTTEYKPPVTDGSGNARDSLRKATELLKEAGWDLKNGKLTNEKGEVFTFEIVDHSPMFERWVQPFLRNLERLGIKASLRVVDTSQYQTILDNFNFDMVISVFPQSLSPGNEQRDFFGSAKADEKGSRNLAGIKEPVVDALIEKLVKAKDRQELTTITKALDRVLLAGYYVIPHWYTGSYNIAYWDKFGMPKIAPQYSLDVTDRWWLDEAKAAKTEALRSRSR